MRFLQSSYVAEIAKAEDLLGVKRANELLYPQQMCNTIQNYFLALRRPQNGTQWLL